MALAPTIWAVFLFVFAIVERSQSTLSRNISFGSYLSPTRKPTYWLCPSGHFAFGFYPQGRDFAVGTWLLDGSPNITVVWTTYADDPLVPSNATLGLTVDRKLVLTGEGGRTRSFVGDQWPIYTASLFDNGNFVLYDSDSEILWQSFEYPTDTILSGQSLFLHSDKRWLSSSVSRTNHTIGKFKLSLEDREGLSLTHAATIDADPSSYWTISGEDFFKLTLDDIGHMYLATENDTILWNFTDGWPSSIHTPVIHRATLDQDGVFRLYLHSMQNNSTPKVEWQSLDEKCSVYGSCGINSYCMVGEPIINCTCVPGFDYINSSERSAGCETRWGNRSFGSFEVVSLQNTWFKADYSSYVRNMEKKDCKEACSTDANCVAALYSYSGTSCYKLQFPLRYGRSSRDKSISYVLFVKLASRDSERGKHFSSISKTSIMILVIGVILTTCSGITMAVYCYLISRRCLWALVRALSFEQKLGTTEDIVLRSFSYDELTVATNGFNQVLGRGSFGTVYKGALYDNEKTVAVKRLEKVVEEGEREFQMEMRAIGRTHHRNLVHLIGFCNEGSNRLLVYEYMKNGPLADFIYRAEGRPLWSDRVRIILEVAKGILYLHEDCEPHIIHCDIKPQNILIDEFRTAKISDFGLAKLLMPNQTRTFTGPRGTRGYLAPEWYQNKRISVKVDIYSFGIVLLEIVCCRRNIELEVEDDEIILTDWISKCYRAGELAKLFHGEEVEKKQFERVVMVGLWCIQSEPAFRPSMKNVILMIEGNMDVQVPPFPAS